VVDFLDLYLRSSLLALLMLNERMREGEKVHIGFSFLSLGITGRTAAATARI